MALFNENLDPAGEINPGTLNAEAERRQSLSDALWSQIGETEIANLSEERRTSIQSTINKLVDFQIEESRPPTLMGSQDINVETKPAIITKEGDEIEAESYTYNPNSKWNSEDPDFTSDVVEEAVDIDEVVAEEEAVVPPQEEIIEEQQVVETVAKKEPVLPTKEQLGIDPIALNEQIRSDLYEGIVNAETRAIVAEGDDFWQRTGTNGGAEEGSSAFGPAQVTKTLFEDMRDRADVFGIADEDMRAIEFFIMQGNEFLEYGNEPNKAGYTPEFDYSYDKNTKTYPRGQGFFSGTEEANKVLDEYGGEEYLKEAYRRVSKAVLGYYNQKYGGDPERVQAAWRFGEKDMKTKTIPKDDKKYGERYAGNF